MYHIIDQKNQYQKDINSFQVEICKLNVIPILISSGYFFSPGARQVDYKVILENRYKTSQECPKKEEQRGTTPH